MASSPSTRVAKLRDEIAQHDYAYYVEAKPTISDRAYDELLAELRALEDAHPELITPDSPTQRVAGEPSAGFDHVTHAVPMLSVDNTYDADQLRQFDARVARTLGDEPYRYLVEPKIDGVAVSLRYEQGRLVLGATRGDGSTGDDVTANLRTLRSVPLRLRGEDWPAVLEVRGEVVWPTESFQRFNEQREQAGEATFANPRNATAGTLKQLDPRSVAGRGLQFVAHGLGLIDPRPRGQTSAFYDRLQEWGIPVSPYRTLCASVEEIVGKLPAWDERRHGLPYETDGLVIKVDDLGQRDELGATGRHPRWCIAYKFAAEQAWTTVRRVEFQVGKLGTITPRAVMDPVQLSGTTVQHATLHNFDQVARLDLHVGDRVLVEKAGEIIPQVVQVDAQLRPADAAAVEPPSQCPACDGAVARDEGGVYLRCLNPACPAQRIERLNHFANRTQMDIEGAGEVLNATLAGQGLLTTPADYYDLHTHRDELVELERLGAKSVDNLLAGIERSKQQPLARLLAALNIRHVGARTAEQLAEHFGHLDALIAADEAALVEVEDVGPEVAASILRFFAQDEAQQLINRLRAAGVNFEQPRSAAAAGPTPLAGKTVVVTGTLTGWSRTEAQELIKQLGGKPTNSVSKRTDLVIYGDSPGSKLAKAEQLGVETMDETAFRAFIGD